MILLYLMYNAKADYTKKELAKRLGLDPVYVTRCTKELVSRGFIEEKRNGRSVEVGRVLGAKELFDDASSAFVSPVRDIIFWKVKHKKDEDIQRKANGRD